MKNVPTASSSSNQAEQRSEKSKGKRKADANIAEDDTSMKVD